MERILRNQFVHEKKVFEEMIVGSVLQEITYTETFNLVFSRTINDSKGDDYNWIVERINLIIDAPFWVGDRGKWEELINDEVDIIEMQDNMIAYELVNIRYDNLIEVQSVEFLERYVHIMLEGGKMMSIAYESDSDYSWILEKTNDNNSQDKLMVLCQGDELFTNNKE